MGPRAGALLTAVEWSDYPTVDAEGADRWPLFTWAKAEGIVGEVCPSCKGEEPLKSGLDARSYYPDAGPPLPCPHCGGSGKALVSRTVRRG